LCHFTDLQEYQPLKRWYGFPDNRWPGGLLEVFHWCEAADKGLDSSCSAGGGCPELWEQAEGWETHLWTSVPDGTCASVRNWLACATPMVVCFCATCATGGILLYFFPALGTGSHKEGQPLSELHFFWSMYSRTWF
jgi:hypothetical protein